MSYTLYPEKQIHLVGLEKTGEGLYTCKLPDLLAEWLKKQGLVEVEAYGHSGHTELMLEQEVPPQPPDSGPTPEEAKPPLVRRGFVHIYPNGTVRVGGASDILEEIFQEVINKQMQRI